MDKYDNFVILGFLEDLFINKIIINQSNKIIIHLTNVKGLTFHSFPLYALL